MQALGPFGPRPHLALAVSGGADSTALALFAAEWAHRHGGTVIALIADHGLRRESAAEAAATSARMAQAGIPARIIDLHLKSGPELQERARTARHAALAAAARDSGAVHLLFGHHEGDQAELLVMRAARGPQGGAGIAGFAARHDVVLLRPLLAFTAAELRAELHERGVGWVEDPSNRDPVFERVRVRQAGAALDRPRHDEAVLAMHNTRTAIARTLARDGFMHPAGFALLRTNHPPPEVLAALIRTIGGAIHPPRRDAVRSLADAMRPATLGGVLITRAGHLGAGWLLCREPAACAPPTDATIGVVWDGRFRIRAIPPGADRLGCLGDAAVAWRRASDLPSIVLRGLPAYFEGPHVVAVPHCQPEAFALLTAAVAHPVCP